MNKQSINKYFKVIASITLMLVISVNAGHAQSANFSGTYKLNDSKTDFDTAPKTNVPVEIHIAQEDDKVVITRTSVDQDQKKTMYSETLKYDGTPTTSVLSSGAKRTASLHWSSDKQQITIKSKSVYPNSSNDMTETWTLKNGKVLAVTRNGVQSNGAKYNIQAEYDKE